MLHTHKPYKADFLTDHCPGSYLLVAAFSALLVLLQFFQAELIFQRYLIMEGEFWRLWTGNLVHTNLWHLALNLGGFWLLVFIQRPAPPSRTLIAQILFISTCVGVGLWFFNQDLIWYAGFSGTLYGLFMLTGIHLLKQKDWVSAALILGGICGKTLWDWSQGGMALSASLIEAPVIYTAHVYGMLGGIMLSLPHFFRHLTNR